MGVESNLPRYMGGKISELVVGLDGKVKMVQCKVCSTIEQREKILVPKLDGLIKHSGRRMCKVVHLSKVFGKSYINLDSQHVRNEKIYAITGHDGIQLQVEKHIRLKRKKKQFVTLFHFLKLGKPSLILKTCMGFYSF